VEKDAKRFLKFARNKLFYFKATFFHSIPNSFPDFVFFFHPNRKKKIFLKLIFFIAIFFIAMKKNGFFFSIVKKMDISSL